MMTLPYPYSSSARFYALRLLPGQEVLSQLRALRSNNNFTPRGLQVVPAV